MNPDTPETSAPQDAWMELADGIRESLAKKVRAGDVKKMNAANLDKFLDACNTAYWFAVNCNSFDSRVTKASNSFQD